VSSKSYIVLRVEVSPNASPEHVSEVAEYLKDEIYDEENPIVIDVTYETVVVWTRPATEVII